MHLRDVIKIGDITLPTPDGLTIQRNKIWSKNAGRTAAGYTVGDIIARKYKIEVSWDWLTAVQVQTITAACDTDAFFFCTFCDPYTNTSKTIEVYAGDISIPVEIYRDNTAYYTGLKISLIER